MATIDVYNLSGGKAGTLDLADEVFGAVNEDLIWEAVTHYRARLRAGTHKTKARWEVSGSGKKLWKQKGTGRARIGSVRSPLWRHGGTVHGPQPRSYDYAFPRKKLMGALRSALAAKFADGKLVVVKSLDVKEPKTKAFAEALGKLKVSGTTLVVDGSAENKNLNLSARNIGGLELVKANEVHPYHLMHRTWVVFAQPALEKLQDSLRKAASRREHPAQPEKKARRSRKAEVALGLTNMKSAYQIIQKPVITEKGLGIKETQNTLVFQVAPKATKTEIKEAVQSIFKVKVASVRTANYPGKERRRGKFAGYRPDWKKAYVRLKSGEKMPEYAQNL